MTAAIPEPAAPRGSAPAEATTPTGYTLLGLLSFGRELSGYELKQMAENLRFFWSAPAMSQVYREVERLAAAGLVSQRSVVREGTRSTKVYRLTDDGEAAIRTWLAAPPEPPVLRHPLALRVFFGHLLDPEELCSALESHRAWCDQMLSELGAIREGLGDQEQFRYAALVAEWGLAYFRGERTAATDVEDGMADHPALVAGARADRADRAAGAD